jgi:hypothetical protein
VLAVLFHGFHTSILVSLFLSETETVERYLTAEVSGDYTGLLRLVVSQNKFGGGQAIEPSLVSLLCFEIQGVALAA